MEFSVLDPTTMGQGPLYDFLTHAIQPRPIAFVSTESLAGERNLAPFSFFMVGGVNPPSLVYCPTLNKHAQPKDSLRNCRETGEFVVNLLTRRLADGMNAAAAEFPPGQSEWPASGFAPLASHLIRPPRVAECPIHFECRVHRIVEHGDGPNAAVYVIGEVLMIHVDPGLLRDGKLDPMLFRPIARLGGADYLDRDGDRTFTLPRPQAPQVDL